MKGETDKEKNTLLENSISGLKFGILQQLISRILTFVLNVLIVRGVSAEIVGIANVQFQLIVSTISMLTRESFRRTALRQNYEKTQESELKKTITFSYWVIPVGLVGCYLVGIFFERTISLEERNVENFVLSMWISVYATMFEILAEPMFILAQNLMLSKIRFFLESSSVLLKCILTYVLVHYFNLGLLAFAYSLLFSTVFVFVGYFSFFIYEIYNGKGSKINFRKLSDILPDPRYIFEIKNNFKILGTFWLQSVLKLVLGEGEKYILKFKESLLDQGIYSIVSNLASLIPRILFAPIEEIAHTYFAKLVDNSSLTEGPHFKKEKLGTAMSVYNSLVKLMLFFGMYLAAFGPPFSFFLLDFLYTSKVSVTDAPLVLSFYCVYILTISVNGVTEAFVHAVGTANELNYFNMMMFVFSTVYIIISFIFITYFKTVGLILANCINMFLRIIFSLLFTNRFFDRNSIILRQNKTWSWKQIFPRKIIFITFVFIFLVCKYSESNFCSKTLIGNGGVLRSTACYGHVGLGGFCLLVSVFIIFMYERDWLNQLKNIWKSKND